MLLEDIVKCVIGPNGRRWGYFRIMGGELEKKKFNKNSK